MANLSGTWLGTYWQREQPTRFEATFLQSNNALTGNILDDGHLGEASLTGEVIGRSVTFTKIYITAPQYRIEYVGTLMEDENFIQGEWRISHAKFRESGLWEARRNDNDLMQELQNQLKRQVSLVATN
ncbi:MAG: hypothetical protein SFW36_10250 [Leptolyngbyaceae cyanobacterium bins.59]|nr:hypothetical protein [Leptolyngbyaceae cyanobacterium bins.59]